MQRLEVSGVVGLIYRSLGVKGLMVSPYYVASHGLVGPFPGEFKHTNIGISFKSTNTLQLLIKTKLANNTEEQDKGSIYKITCNTCQMSYIGQTSRSLKQRYQEHVRYVRNNEPQSACALHILNNKHEYGPINNTITLLNIPTKLHYY